MILYISLFTLFLSFSQSIYNFRINKNALYLTGFLIPISLLGLLHYFNMNSNNVLGLAIMYGHFMPLYYLAGPMLFFYVRGTLLDDSRLKRWDFLHFIPFVIGLLSIFPYYFVPFENKMEMCRRLISDINFYKTNNISWLFDNSVNLVMRFLSLLLYGLISLFWLFRYLYQQRKIISTIPDKKIISWWLFLLIVLTTGIAISYLHYLNSFYTTNVFTKETANSITINSIAGISFSLIPITLICFPRILYGLPLARTIEENWLDNPKTNSLIQEQEKFENKKNDAFFETLSQTILEYLQNEKPFTNADFSIDALAENLHLPKHHLYYCFNTILKTKFTTVRTQMRVDYAKECLLNGDLNHLSMEGVWRKAGFSSKTNFFVSFKEVTQMTPLDFIKIHHL